MIFDWLLSLFKGASSAVGDTSTAGPTDDEHPLVSNRDVFFANVGTAGSLNKLACYPTWSLGLWHLANFRPMHPGRVGPTIQPRCTVVHTTDMHPNSFDALVKSWTTQPGAGNGAHFLIGRTPEQGVIQFASLTRNANHAGGGTHGNYRTPSGSLVHPNTIAVGVELDCAGLLYRDAKGLWRSGEYGAGKLVYNGTPLPLTDVYVDERGRGWHMITEYQRGMLLHLLADLQACYPPGFNYTVAPNGTYQQNGTPWAACTNAQVVGHATLDPYNKTDPGPVVTALIQEKH